MSRQTRIYNVGAGAVKAPRCNAAAAPRARRAAPVHRAVLGEHLAHHAHLRGDEGLGRHVLHGRLVVVARDVQTGAGREGDEAAPPRARHGLLPQAGPLGRCRQRRG